MRYLENQPLDPNYSYTQSMHDMLSLSMWLGIIIGIALLILGKRGNILWLKVWSVGLTGVSAAYLIADLLNFI